MPGKYYIIIWLAFRLASCSGEQNPDLLYPPRPVRTVKIESLETTDKTYTGIAEASQFSILAFKISGTLTELNVKQGQWVPQGYTIARINPADYELKYQTAETDYQTARSINQRTHRLLEQNAIALQNAEISQADYIQANSAVSIAKNFNPVKNEIYPGFSCRILFRIENTIASNFVIPASALYTQNRQTYVWVVDPESKTVSLHPVKAVRFEDKAVVQTGLNSHDIIVTAGVCDLQEGQKVSLHE